MAKQLKQINRYTLEIIKNGGGWRGLLINFKTELVERRTGICKQKKQAIDALVELVEEFKNGEKEALIQGVTVISKTEISIDIDWIRGIDDEEYDVSN